MADVADVSATTFRKPLDVRAVVGSQETCGPCSLDRTSQPLRPQPPAPPPRPSFPTINILQLFGTFVTIHEPILLRR